MPNTSVSVTPIFNAVGAGGQGLRHDLANLHSLGILHVVAMGADGLGDQDVFGPDASFKSRSTIRLKAPPASKHRHRYGGAPINVLGSETRATGGLSARRGCGRAGG